MTRTPKGRLKSRLSKLGLNHASVRRIRRWRPVQEIRDHGPKEMGAALQLLFTRGQDQTVRRLILSAA